MRASLIILSTAALGLTHLYADEFTKPKELKNAAIASFKFEDSALPKQDNAVAGSPAKSKKEDAEAFDPAQKEDFIGDVVALDPFEVTEDKIPVVTHKPETSLGKYLESGALYTHEGKKVTTRIVLSPITGFGVRFSW